MQKNSALLKRPAWRGLSFQRWRWRLDWKRIQHLLKGTVMNWPGAISLFRIAEYRNYQTAKRRSGMASYTLCTRTFCTSACQTRGACNCTGESERGEKTSTARTSGKLRQSSRCTLSEDGIISGRQNIFSRQQTTPSVDLLIARRSDLRAVGWNCFGRCRTLPSAPNRNYICN